MQKKSPTMFEYPWLNYPPISRSHAEICPICRGSGKVKEETYTTAGAIEKVCHGCGGRGWITVHD